MSDIEQNVYDAVIANEPNAYGVKIMKTMTETTSPPPNYGKLYIVLNKLEEAGFVRSESRDPTPERGGRNKRFWYATEQGRRARSRVHAVAYGSLGICPA